MCRELVGGSDCRKRPDMKESLKLAVPTTRVFAARQAERLLRAVSTRISQTVRSPGIDHVHDLRVAIRRYRRVLSVLKACFPADETREIRRELKRIMKLAGNVRDHDIALELFPRVVLPLSTSEKPLPIITQLQTARAEAARALSASLRTWRPGGLPTRWRKALHSGQRANTQNSHFCGATPESAARAILPAMAEAHFRAGEKACRDKASMDELHKFRIAAKNLRYTLDMFAPLYGEALQPLVERLKEAQDLLGEIHDYAVVRDLLGEEKEGGKSERRKILADLKKRQHRKIEQFRLEYADEFSSDANLLSWKKSLLHTKRRGGKATSRRKTALR